MTRTLANICLAILLAAGTGGAEAACERPVYAAAFRKPLPGAGIDQARFAEAMRLEANFVRCRNGLAPLAAAEGLTAAAARHAGWMAANRKLSHDGDQQFKARMRGSGVRFAVAAENIASHERYAFPEGPFRIVGGAPCGFRTEEGAMIPPHSYASLARRVVEGWMTSPGHRRNLLNRRLGVTGAGVGFDAAAPYCGRYYVSQSYAG